MEANKNDMIKHYKLFRSVIALKSYENNPQKFTEKYIELMSKIGDLIPPPPGSGKRRK